MTMNSNFSKILKTVFAVVVLVALDQLSKFLVITKLKPVGTTTVVDGILQFRYVENTGAAFSMLSNNTTLLSVVTSLIMVAILVALFAGKVTDKLQYISLVIVVAGGIGNLIDRIARGYVVDFIEYTFVNYAVFNVADIFVTIGALLLVASIVMEIVRESKEKKEQSDADDE